MADTAILVTGADGFIGSQAARVLAAPTGLMVPGLVVFGATRDGRTLGPGILPRRLDVRDPASLAAALRGIDAVVHCAVGDRTTTVAGTTALLHAARTAGVRRVVHLSSVSVYGAAPGALPETTALVSPSGPRYANWKAAAEAACQAAAGPDLQVTMLRPAIVYGAASRLWITLAARRLRSPRWGGLGSLGLGTCNPIHVDDVAGACAAAIQAPDLPGCQAFNISGPQSLTWNAWFDRLRLALHIAPPPDLAPAVWHRRALASLPLKLLARWSPTAARRFEAAILTAPGRGELALFGLAATYPTERAAALLDWHPRIDLTQGLADTFEAPGQQAFAP